MDTIERGISDQYGLRFICVDVTDTASVLALRHRSGPVATEILAQALAAAGLLSSDLENEHECISIQLQVDGPIQGLLVEAAFGGKLRGYTNRKTSTSTTNIQTVAVKESLGNIGKMAVMHSEPGRLIYSGHIQATPPDLEKNLARFYNMSRQVPTAVCLFTLVTNQTLERAVGLAVQKLPFADTQKFVEVLECFNDGRIRRVMAGNASLADVAQPVRISDIMTVGSGRFSFECRCNFQKIVKVLSAFPDSDIREMSESKEPQTVTCHFCGEVYLVSRVQLETILTERKRTH